MQEGVYLIYGKNMNSIVARAQRTHERQKKEEGKAGEEEEKRM